MAKTFNLERLLIDVFAPEAGEKVLVMRDLPHDQFVDNQRWASRRRMAEEWHGAFQRLGERVGFTVWPSLNYPATGAHNSPLPDQGEMGGKEVRLEEVLADTNIAVALTEYSATAPLVGFIQKFPPLRVASMPRVVKEMEETALAADYTEVARRSHLLAHKLDLAIGGRVKFSTGDEVYFDLRHRHSEADDGRLHRDKPGLRLINLPSGEACIAPYEGELEGEPSRTEGTIPAIYEGELLLFKARENRIVEVVGDGPKATEKRAYFAVDPARCNIAELGLGCNEQAIVRGVIIEDEKVLGLHWAYGRSDHIGGTVGVDAFSDPSHVVHQDIIYAKGSPIEVVSLVLEYQDGSSERIIEEGNYTVF